MGRERFVGDEEKSRPSIQDIADDSQPSQPWYKRFMGALWVREGADGRSETEEQSSEQGSVRGRIRPQLTISTAHASKLDRRLPTIEMTSPDAEPVSAWSVSPGPPPKQPWMTTIVPAKKPALLAPPFHPKSRRTASVPLDVDPARDSLMQATLPAPLAPVPLHHGYSFPPPPSKSTGVSMQMLAPPPPHPSLSHQQAINPDTSTPVTRLLTTTHARKSSQALDPFVTPFDDENGVDPQSGKDTPTNPFVAMAF